MGPVVDISAVPATKGLVVPATKALEERGGVAVTVLVKFLTIAAEIDKSSSQELEQYK